jgi:hypothetical protein
MTTPQQSLFKFDADLKKFAKTIGLETAKVRKKVAFEVFKGVVEKTPVDTGFARSGWSMADTRAVLAEPKATKKKPLASQQPAQFKNPFDVTVIANSVPYILALEYGHSQEQAPLGMVRVTLAEVEAGLLDALQ